MEPVERVRQEQLPNTLSDEPILEPEEFARRARDVDASMTFATSRSGRPAPVADPDHIARIVGDMERLMGMDEDDGLLNLGAPRPHLSGWVGRRGAEAIGAAVYNDHYEDYHRVIEGGHAGEMTAIGSVPTVAKTVLEELRREYGPPDEVFPNLELGLFSGEMLQPSDRRGLADQWGLDRVREFYGSSEISGIACAIDETRRLVPLLQHLIVEVEVDGEILDVREPTEPVEGEILVTDPGREAIDLTRYRQGDWIRVYPGEELPRIEPLGRADDAIDFDGALLHPADLYAVLDAVFDDADFEDGEARFVPYVREETPPTTLTLFVVGATVDRTDAFFDRLFEARSPIEYVVDAADEERIRLEYVESVEETPLEAIASDGLKTRQIVFESDL